MYKIELIAGYSSEGEFKEKVNEFLNSQNGQIKKIHYRLNITEHTNSSGEIYPIGYHSCLIEYNAVEEEINMFFRELKLRVYAHLTEEERIPYIKKLITDLIERKE